MSKHLVTPAYHEPPTDANHDIDDVAWKKRLTDKGVEGDIDAVIERAKKTGTHDATAAIGELESFERAADRGHGKVVVKEPLSGLGAPQGIKSPEGRTLTNGQEGAIEAKTATEPPQHSTVNAHVDKANRQLKSTGLTGEIYYDFSKVNVSMGQGLTNQQEIESFINGKMMESRLRSIGYFEIRWRDKTGILKATHRSRVDGVLSGVTTVDI